MTAAVGKLCPYCDSKHNVSMVIKGTLLTVPFFDLDKAYQEARKQHIQEIERQVVG